MSVAQFKERFSRHLRLKRFEIIVNENRSTMLNLLERGRNFARLSIHKMFLDAPEEVISAIAHYVRGTRHDRKMRDQIIRGYIQQNLPRLDYSAKIDRSKLITRGEVYDLGKIYAKINRLYFSNQLRLAITWYGLGVKKKRSRVVFGQYCDTMKLVKIHRMLDNSFFPDYFVEFIVYHEMLHSVVPGYLDEKGYFRVHGAEFKARERAFHHYAKAITWEKMNKKYFLKGYSRGRA